MTDALTSANWGWGWVWKVRAKQLKQFNHQKKCLKFFSKISFAVFQKQIAIRELRRLILHPAPEIAEIVLKIGIDKL